MTLWTAGLQASLLHKDTSLTTVFHAYDHHSCSSHLYHMHRAMLPKVRTKGRQFPETVREINIIYWNIVGNGTYFTLFRVFYAILNIKGAEKSSANKPIFLNSFLLEYSCFTMLCFYCTAKRIRHTYMETYIPSLLDCPSHSGHHSTLGRISCSIQYVLISYLFFR